MPLFVNDFQYNLTQKLSMTISSNDKLVFQNGRSKVKGTVAIFREKKEEIYVTATAFMGQFLWIILRFS